MVRAQPLPSGSGVATILALVSRKVGAGAIEPSISTSSMMATWTRQASAMLGWRAKTTPAASSPRGGAKIGGGGAQGLEDLRYIAAALGNDIDLALNADLGRAGGLSVLRTIPIGVAAFLGYDWWY
jgi:hypothetical protein